jgi:hypothetical protein
MILPPAGEKKAAESEDSRGEKNYPHICPDRRTNRTPHFGGVDRCNQPVERILTQMRIICNYRNKLFVNIPRMRREGTGNYREFHPKSGRNKEGG